MILEQDRSALGRVATQAGGGVVLGDILLVVDGDTVLPDADHTLLHLLATFEDGWGEVDIVGLPDGWGLAGVDQRLGHAVDAAAIVVFAIEAIAVKHLHLVAALHIHAAVATALTTGLGHVGHAEFHMQQKRPGKFFPGDNVTARAAHNLQLAGIGYLPAYGALAALVFPGIGGFTVEKHHSTFRGGSGFGVDGIGRLEDFQAFQGSVGILAASCQHQA